MSSKRALFALFAYLVFMGSMFFGGLAYAQVPDVDVDVPTPQVNVDVDPQVPSGSEINCEIFAQLVANGLPIPPGFDSSDCDGNSGGGGGNGSTPACSDGIDNDVDTLIDSADPGCSDSTDTDEANTPDGGNGGNGGGDSGGGSGGGGNSGGPAPECEDSLDNDGDGLKDMADPGCESASDNDERNGSSGGGGGGGGSVSTSAATSSASSETSLPVVASCDMYLTAFIKPGIKNDEEQVKRLQSLLNESEGAAITVSGSYDAATIAAVHAFQTKYSGDILKPWGATKSTGFVYLTTRKKVNEIYCKLTKEFPLTSEENEIIAKSRSVLGSSVTKTPGVSAPKPKVQVKEEIKTEEVGSTKTESQTAAAGNESATRSINRLWSPITNLFNRIFGR